MDRETLMNGTGGLGSRRRCPAALTFTAEAAVPRVPFPVVLPVVPIISVVPIVPAVAVVPVVPIFASVPVVRRAWAPLPALSTFATMLARSLRDGGLAPTPTGWGTVY